MLLTNGNSLSFILSDQEDLHQICLLLIEKQSERCFNTQLISNTYVWSPDSRYIAYLSKTPAQEVDIFVVDLFKEVITNITQDGNRMTEQSIAQ